MLHQILQMRLKILKSEKEIVSIATNFDRNFLHAFHVFLQSIISNCSQNYFYDIIILTEGLTKYDLEVIAFVVSKHDNISVRNVDMSHFNIQFLEDINYKRPTFFRLILPNLLYDYEKLLYIDADTVVIDDLSTLFFSDFTGYAAVVKDIIVDGMTHLDMPFLQINEKGANYFLNYVKMSHKAYKNYFNAGLMLLNLPKIRETRCVERALQLIQEKPYIFADQDILNLLFDANITLLSMRWNYFNELPNGINYNNALLQERNNVENNLGIIHFAGQLKPFYTPNVHLKEFFWFYARQTLYYEQLQEELSRNIARKKYSRRFFNYIKFKLQRIFSKLQKILGVF